MTPSIRIIHPVASLIIGAALLVALNLIAVHLFHLYVFGHFVIAWLILSAIAWVALPQVFPQLTPRRPSSSEGSVSADRSTQIIGGLTILCGVATGVRHASSIEGAMNRGTGNVHTKHHVSLRVGQQPVEITLMSAADINDGETVSVAGKKKRDGTFRGFAIRNDSTRAVYAMPTAAGMAVGIFLVIIGMPLILLVGIGLVFIGAGGHLVFKMHRCKTAANMLRNG
jgi:hypothetical protein